MELIALLADADRGGNWHVRGAAIFLIINNLLLLSYFIINWEYQLRRCLTHDSDFHDAFSVD